MLIMSWFLAPFPPGPGGPCIIGGVFNWASSLLLTYWSLQWARFDRKIYSVSYRNFHSGQKMVIRLHRRAGMGATIMLMFFKVVVEVIAILLANFYTPAQRSWRGVYWIHLVSLSVCPSVCRRHGFRSISQVCFGISISNFICMLMVAIGRRL